jgi:hypothetical protein
MKSLWHLCHPFMSSWGEKGTQVAHDPTTEGYFSEVYNTGPCLRSKTLSDKKFGRLRTRYWDTMLLPDECLTFNAKKNKILAKKTGLMNMAWATFGKRTFSGGDPEP